MNSFVKSAMLATALSLAGIANAAVVTAYYGDDDGFGIGRTSGTIDATSELVSPDGDLTDQRLIGNVFAGNGFPAFAPTGSFAPFTITGNIISATLTLRTGSFDSAPALDAPNRILLNGITVSSSFIDGFSSANTNNIETRTFALDSSFFSTLSTGSVSLDGTHISEASGSGSFAIDFLRLDITTEDVPEPAMLGLFGLGALGVGFSRRRRSA